MSGLPKSITLVLDALRVNYLPGREFQIVTAAPLVAQALSIKSSTAFNRVTVAVRWGLEDGKVRKTRHGWYVLTPNT